MWITCDRIIGHGLITANGGNAASYGGGGAGGRISVISEDLVNLNVTTEAAGGKVYD